MEELKNEIKRVEKVIENYKKEYEILREEKLKEMLKKTIIRSEGVLFGLKKAESILNKEVL